MQAHSHSIKLPQRLQSLATLAALLERLDREAGNASAGQYQDVAARVRQLLEDAEPDEHLDRLLQHAPATAELYENLNYARAGLCRSPLGQATEAELQALKAIARARR